ncbi:chromosome segregation protein SMC, partial [Candidatus Woesearchaeota archaeon]
GKTKKPAKEGEVSIYFDNSDKTFPTNDPYVKITRIVRQNGTSIYKINDETRTRAQILELLSLAKINPDGYNIILQGDIVTFVNMSSNERRAIIEQIAGISVYEERRQKAERELEKVEEKLKEADIILAERETYLKELKKERDQALRYKELQDRIKTHRASFLHKKIKEKEEKIKDYESRIEKIREQTRKTEEEINGLKEKIAEKKEEIRRITKEIEERGEKSQVALHKEVEKLRVDIATGEQKIKSYENEINRLNTRKEQLYSSLNELEGKISETRNRIDELDELLQEKKREQATYEEKISEFKKKYNLEDSSEIDKEIEKIDAEADEKQKEIQKLREEQQELLRTKDRLEFRISSMEEQVEKVRQIQKENEAELASLKDKKAEFKNITVTLAQLLNEDSSLSAQLGNARAKLLKTKEKLAEITARNITIQEKVAGDIAVQKILENKSRLKGVVGSVTELGEVESKYAMAMEVAAGPRLKSIVVERDADAAECIKYLKKNRLGTATFLPINKIKGAAISDEARKLTKINGVHGLAIDLISYDPRYRNVFRYVFGNTLVVDNIDVARRIGVGKIRMVTLDGDLVETSGAMQGGFRKRKTGAAFREKELSGELEKYEKEEQDTLSLIKTLEKRKEEVEEKIGELREKKAELEGDIIRIEKSLHLEDSDLEASLEQKKELERELEEADKKLFEIESSISSMNSELAQMKIKKQQLREKISELRNPTKLAELNTFEEKLSLVKEEILKIESEKKSLASQVDDILRPEQANIQKIIKQHDKEESSFRQNIQNLKEELKAKKEELKEKEKQEKEFYAQFKKMFNERNKLNDEIQKLENKAILQEEKIRRTDAQANALMIEQARVKAELAGLEEEFKEYEGVKIIENKSLEDLHLAVKEAEREINRMGNVNLKALEVYENVQKEYDELTKKREKLESEKSDVLVMMNEIEVKKKEVFLETFEKVNKNFQEIFGMLTTKGEASLVLENPESPFEGGVRIRVRITGNKFLDIRSLSGGEKTMTALAFIFAIQEHDPAPFYVLDEVDAALDKRNSEKLAKMIRKYCDRAQYIVISHNDGVISEADNLYGVSMNEHGISKVVSLKV